MARVTTQRILKEFNTLQTTKEQVNLGLFLTEIKDIAQMIIWEYKTTPVVMRESSLPQDLSILYNCTSLEQIFEAARTSKEYSAIIDKLTSLIALKSVKFKQPKCGISRVSFHFTSNEVSEQEKDIRAMIMSEVLAYHIHPSVKAVPCFVNTALYLSETTFKHPLLICLFEKQTGVVDCQKLWQYVTALAAYNKVTPKVLLANEAFDCTVVQIGNSIAFVYGAVCALTSDSITNGITLPVWATIPANKIEKLGSDATKLDLKFTQATDGEVSIAVFNSGNPKLLQIFGEPVMKDNTTIS